MVHHRRRHRHRGLLSPHRHSADQGSRLHHRRRRGLLGRVAANLEYRVALATPGVPAVEITHTIRASLHAAGLPFAGARRAARQRQLEGDAALRPYALSPRDWAATRRTTWRRSAISAAARCSGPSRRRSGSRSPPGRAGRRRLAAVFRGLLRGERRLEDFDRHGRMTWSYDSAGAGRGGADRRASLRCVSRWASPPARKRRRRWRGLGADGEFDHRWDEQRDAWERWLAASRGPSCATNRPRARAVRDRAEGSSGPHVSRRRRREPRGALGRREPQPRRLSPGLAARPRRDRGRAGRLGRDAEARDTLRYLIATQQTDGHWHQNQWLGGHAVLAGRTTRRDRLSHLLAIGAAARDARRHSRDRHDHAGGGLHRAEGPGTGKDRWEEDAGVNIFTLAVAIAALVEASAFLEGEAAPSR